MLHIRIEETLYHRVRKRLELWLRKIKSLHKFLVHHLPYECSHFRILDAFLHGIKTRDLPGLKTYLERKGELPEGLVLGLAGITTYYKGGKRGDVEIVPNDDAAIIELLKNLWATGDVRKVAEGVLAAEFIWGEDLNQIPGLTDLVTADLELIRNEGMRAAVRTVIA